MIVTTRNAVSRLDLREGRAPDPFDIIPTPSNGRLWVRIIAVCRCGPSAAVHSLHRKGVAKMVDSVDLGIIGGSGLYALDGFQPTDEIRLTTPYGEPSSLIHTGTLAGRGIAFISRHGTGHRLAPSEVPYAANIYALKSLGVRRVLSVSAVGSLREDVAPRSFVVPDGLIDRTLARRRSFFGEGAVAHVSIADPYCPDFSAAVAQAAREAGGLPVHEGGAYVCIEGPQFSTRAESRLFRSWEASIIGMTAFPEARLAREAELCYACLAMVTDYDVWHTEGDVSVELVIANLQAMTAAVAAIVPALAAMEMPACGAGCADALANAIITERSAIPAEAVERLGPIASRYLGERDGG
jgi:5'-methylthioadenosine phosphorylase